LYFNDLRKFGWLRLFPREIVDHTSHQSLESFLESLQLGPEPLSSDFTPLYLAKLVGKRSISIKQLLLEQKGISGIGNIYADEALFRAGIRPTRKAISLKSLEIGKLHQAIRDVLELGIEHGGTSKNTYLNVDGTKGEMQHHLKVYQHTGKPCIVCANPIERIKIGQRSSHFCPKCQK
jgi:formamidopyrimidine-DNA glycosylase